MSRAKAHVPIVVIVTRLAIDPFSDPNRSLKVHDEPERNLRARDHAWLRERLELFSKTALPSVLSQGRLPDHWLIVLDQIWSDALKNFEGLPECAEFLLLSESDDLAEAIRRRLYNLGDDILTIRLDSDDLISPKFVSEAVRRSKPFRAINFVHGVQFWIADGTLAHYFMRSNPFVGFRSGDTRLNVHDFGQHRRVGDTVRVVDVWTFSPMFMKISHKNNHVFSRPGGIPVINLRLALSKFPRVPYGPTSTVTNAVALSRRSLRHFLNRKFPKTAQRLVRLRKLFT
jgi:hypothetical protein